MVEACILWEWMGERDPKKIEEMKYIHDHTLIMLLPTTDGTVYQHSLNVVT